MSKDTPFPPGARVAGYFRDSGGDEQDLSVSRQLAEFRRWLSEHGLVEGATFTDAARPGSSVVGREAFQHMLRHFRGGPPEAGLVIWRSNRFGRNVEDSQFYKADLRRQGYLVYSLTDKIPPDRYGKLIEFVLDWKDEEFLHALSEDVSSGLRNIVQAYGAVPGSPPHGFLREPVEVGLRRDGRPHILHRWVPDQTLAPLVRRAFEMLARGEPLSKIHLATGLYSSKNSYVTFFRNPLYKGTLRFGDLTIPDYCAPVVDPVLWEAVQHLLDRRSSRLRKALPDAKDPRRATSHWLLSGLLFCARCNSPMNGHRVGPRNYYICSRAARWHNCDTIQVPARALESAVIEHLRDYLSDPSVLAAAQSERFRLYRETVSGLPARRQELITRLDNLRRQINNITTAVADGRYSAALMDKLTALEVQEFQLREERAELERLLTSPPRPIGPERMKHLADRLQSILADADDLGRHRALAGWIQRIRAERTGKMVRVQLALFLAPQDPEPKKKEGARDKRALDTAPPWGHHPITLQIEILIPVRKRGRKPSR